ncbi:hypothetical protein B8V81_5075 [Paenibacillus pasadenensis]|uniref:Phosphoadenosine phosphosulphate reductase domain-containing protein n=1 Tax=Paenibacillus pasadenensis TaxID=217090 RepID=A0A2N5MZL9_9BACL|nr:hypothetical protein B8V81_5075 [Paenibacillus pasadenensis]
MHELESQGRTTIYSVLSFGGGTQSGYLLEQHFRGEIEYDFIIFSDTGAEPEFIHEQVAWWQERQRSYGNQTPFLIARHGSMPAGLEEMLMRYIYTDYQRLQLPLYCSQLEQQTGEMKPAGMMPRQCTVDFKIVPVQQAARQAVLRELQLGPRQRLPKDIGFIIDIGFSYDEIRRIQSFQSPQYAYMYLAYPLVEQHVTTEASIQELEAGGCPVRRSRCYLCPFQCDGSRDIGMDWDEIIRAEPLSFLKACWFDEHLRIAQRSGHKLLRSLPYLHYTRQPLAQVYREAYRGLLVLHGKDLEAWRSGWEKRMQLRSLAG